MTPPDEAQSAHITATIFELLAARAEDATICPSEVARAVAPENWRPLMPTVREIAARLAEEGTIDVRQGGVVIELTGETRGPVRLGLPRAGA